MTVKRGFRVNRRNLFGMVAGGIVGSALTAGRAAAASDGDGQQSASRPNLILYFIDECRPDALATYGNPVCKTPNFDLLASQGTRFADCHVQFPVCGASRCSLLTGLPPSPPRAPLVALNGPLTASINNAAVGNALLLAVMGSVISPAG
jgi:choline-sulfatase